MLYSEYPFVLGTGQKNNFQYRWVPVTGSKKILGTDGYRKNFHLCRPLISEINFGVTSQFMVFSTFENVGVNFRTLGACLYWNRRARRFGRLRVKSIIFNQVEFLIYLSQWNFGCYLKFQNLWKDNFLHLIQTAPPRGLQLNLRVGYLPKFYQL